MPIIIYGGARETVEKQLKCDHDWHGPNMDPISRYMKCLKCFCIERDLLNEAEYFKAASNTDAVGKKDKKRQSSKR
jgi:hypothetical protein